MSASFDDNASAGAAMVHLVDDDNATRDAMHTLFDSVSLPNRTYRNAEEFIAGLPIEQPGCLVLDLRMPGMSGLELQRILQERGYHIPVIFLSGHGNISAAVRAMHGGAADFLTKPVDDEALIEKVQAAIGRDQANACERAEREAIRLRMDSLTPREAQVLRAVAGGLSNKITARELNISPKTVELHRAHMMEKMQARSIADVVQMHYTVVGAAAAASEQAE